MAHVVIYHEAPSTMPFLTIINKSVGRSYFLTSSINSSFPSSFVLHGGASEV